MARKPLRRLMIVQERQTGAFPAQRDADRRYQIELDGYMLTLYSERTLYAYQTTLVDAKLQIAPSQVNLIKRLGGGWEPQ